MKQEYKFLEHTADIKFHAFGNSLEKVFENSAFALRDSISDDKIKSEVKKNLYVQGKNLEELLYSFLEEFLILFDEEGFILSKIEKIDIKEKQGKYELNVSVLGDSMNDSGEKNYEISNHVKAITYNDMFIKKSKEARKERWTAQVVIDV